MKAVTDRKREFGITKARKLAKEHLVLLPSLIFLAENRTPDRLFYSRNVPRCQAKLPDWKVGSTVDPSLIA